MIGRAALVGLALLAAGSDAGERPGDGLRCEPADGPRFGAHVEVFIDGRAVLIPPGLGIGGPAVRDGAYVDGGRCRYPLITREPTGVVEVRRGARVHLGDLFALWDRALTANRLGGVRGAVIATVDGRRWRGDPRAIGLTAHAQVVVQVGRRVVPHSAYRFPPGL